MNSVILIGRLTKDPAMVGTVCKFTIAIDRAAGEEKKTDFPQITVFGKQGENCARFLKKGRLVSVQGRLQTGSYTDKNGNMIFTTDVIGERVEFLDREKNPGGFDF